MRHHPHHRPARRLGILAAAAVALTVLAPSIALSAEPTIQLLPGSRLWLEGNSTMHAYKAEAKRLDFVVTTATGVPDVGGFEQAIRQGTVRGVVLTVPVAELRSEKSGLEKNMKSALKADKHPTITFTMGQYSVADADSFTLKATGKLTIAGVERPIDIVARAQRSGDAVILSGNESLLMTDYGIKPPTMMMGAIKTANAVVVRFELRLAPAVADALGATPRTTP